MKLPYSDDAGRSEQPSAGIVAMANPVILSAPGRHCGLRILQVVYDCQPGNFQGGVRKAVFELAQAQTAIGETVEIWTLGEEEERNAGGAAIRYFKQGPIPYTSTRMKKELSTQRSRFDVIHAHNTFLPLNCYVASAARRGSRAFYHVHGALDPKILAGWSPKALKKRIYNAFFERPNLNSAAAVFGLTEDECSQLHAFGLRVPVIDIPNGINPPAPPRAAASAEFRHRLGIVPEQPIILFIGRIVKKKGLHRIIRAMAVIRARYSGAVLVIAGDRSAFPGYVRRLDDLSRQLGLCDAVKWVGFLGEKEKPAAYDAASVFVHASESEGMSLAILEAMAVQVATVVTPGCYMRQARDAGALLESGSDPGELGGSIIRLLDDDALRSRLAAEGRSFVTARHDWTAIASRLHEIYTAALRGEDLWKFSAHGS